MDIKKYRANPVQQERIADLMAILPKDQSSILEIGARDGFISLLLTKDYQEVTALDLEKPDIERADVVCVQGDVTNLQFSDSSFDVVLCAEVLEHIRSDQLELACNEITRVAKRYVVIGVPFKQDIRVGRTTCDTCGAKNPPWGHVNKFDKNTLLKLFSALNSAKTTFVGLNSSKTNYISMFLMDMASNPGGIYNQEEPCVMCGNKLVPPSKVTFFMNFLNRFGSVLRRVQSKFTRPHPNWIHIVFEKRIHT